MDFQIIEVDGLDKIVLIEPRFVMPFKFIYRSVQPNGFAKVELVNDFVQGAEYFVGPCIAAAIADDSIF